MKKKKSEWIHKALVIFNPVSGVSVLRYGDEKIIKKYLKRKKIEYIFLETKEDNEKELKKFQPENFDLIIAVGGDGTVREVAHWMLKHKTKTPLAIIPGGSTNVYALGLGIPLTIRRALKFAVENKALPQDMGLVNNEKYFLFAAGAGYSAKFAQATTRDLKKIWGSLAYWAIAVVHSFNRDYIEGELQIDGEKRKIKTRALVIFNVRSAFSVNPYVPLDPTPGLLDVLIADEITVANVMRLAKRLTEENRTLDQNQVKLIKTKKLSFKSNEEIPMEIDGETWTGKELNIELIPKALRIVCKKQL
ncbi:MAG: diacylglycerol kinase family protein [Patescibacteria group bacterium]|nr:diacylglycerol kinase family lipid kinase [Patescibacteria group bacterium]